MSIKTDLPPAMAQEAQGYADLRGTTLDAMIRACLLVFVARDGMKGGAQVRRDPASSGIKIGLMKDEVRLPDNFDEVFDSLDGEVASLLTERSL